MPTPDQCAELLQIPERGPALVKRCLEDERISKAVQMVASGFSPSDVAQALELDWSAQAHEEYVEQELEGKIKVWECTTIRCKQKGKVSTAEEAPNCPQCGREMAFVMAVDSAAEISHMARTSLVVSISDPLSRTDRTRDSAPEPGPGWATTDDE
jgi:hypothetical protein